ncbi:MAG: S1 family peptidase [Rubrobacteraceae bacterium]
MTRSVKGPLWATLFAFIAAMAFLFALLHGGEPARAGDGYRQPQVIGGDEVPDGKYPFVAVLYDRVYGSPFKAQFCGGALIDRNSVLTAAHCVEDTPAKRVGVTVGRTVLSSRQGKVRRVSRIHVHPKWNPRTFANDTAVLKLNKPVKGVAPIELATESQDSLEEAGESATVAGWGNTIAQPPDGGAGSRYPDRMREAPVPLVSDSDASQIYGTDFIESLMVAAGETGKDACKGDSGGPMFTRVSGKYTQIGITSWGVGCGAEGFPGVYAEVNSSSIRSFIVKAARR